MKHLGLAFLAGLISAFGFQPVGWWPLTLLGFGALIWLVERAPRLRAALARGWWFGLGQFVLGLNWIATAFTFQAAMPAWLGWVAVVLLSLYLAVYPAMAAGLAWRWAPNSPLPLAGCSGEPRPARLRSFWEKDRPEHGDPRSGEGEGPDHISNPHPLSLSRERERGKDPLLVTILLAAGWIVTEWLRATMFTGFAWNPAGVALLDRSIAPVAALVGTYGLSGIVVIFAGLLRIALVGPNRRAAIPLALFALLAQVAALFATGAPAAGSGPAVRIVQPNIGQEQKWSPEFAERNMMRLGELSRSSSAAPRLLIWPEAAVTDPLEDGRRLLAASEGVMITRREVQSLMAPRDLLLTGGITIQSRDGFRATSATNSVFAIAPDGRILARYDKAHLVPYGEYLPMRPLLSAIGLSRLAPGDLDFDPGPGPQTLDIPGIGPVGFQLCYEMIFSGEVVDRAHRPAFIFNPSNDAWFGAWGPPQHLAQARLRALEEGVPIVRATPTGISAIIDGHGRLVRFIPHGRMGVIDANLPRPTPPTLFARLGNLLPFAFALLLVLAAGILRRRDAAGRPREATDAIAAAADPR